MTRMFVGQKAKNCWLGKIIANSVAISGIGLSKRARIVLRLCIPVPLVRSGGYPWLTLARVSGPVLGKDKI